MGAAVDGADGPLDVRADGTVLATGGYAASRELFRELTPGAPELVTAASPTSTGDGIRAARAAGAAIRGGDRFIPQLGGFEQAPGRLYDWPHFAVLSPVVRPPRELHVNAHGARFHPEDDPSPDARERAVWRQPGRRFWLVFDEAALVGGPSFHRTWDADEIRRRAHQDEIAWTSHSLEKLAERAGLDPGGLRATVDAWNASSPALARRDAAVLRHRLAGRLAGQLRRRHGRRRPPRRRSPRGADPGALRRRRGDRRRRDDGQLDVRRHGRHARAHVRPHPRPPSRGWASDPVGSPGAAAEQTGG